MSVAATVRSVVLALSFALGGCVAVLDATANAVSTQAIVVSASALYFGLPDSDITLLTFDKGLTRIKFQASVKGFLFHCKYHFALVTCDGGTLIPAAP